MKHGSPSIEPGGAHHTRIVTLTIRNVLSDKAFEVELTRPSFDVMPGQNIRFLYGALERYYSIISGPQEQKIALLIRHVADGAFTSILSSSAMGARFSIFPLFFNATPG